ncbi:XRE family transcriptional regulator [Sphingomonas sp. M1-B02]|uniref:XRE family transcriptional regulator n=1 Tax=Sphingomonas sp. M1-B02 TaxID=3114300 RepID=UPI002240BD59|nr:ImmA/IrrE family metallo-endopeptidase [Sphingomonas sp. S6-11]UZK67159.1 ImmA/IrrE family metallo-endopeptidase [Sphingomonas sp. S6-11]
MTQIAVKKEMLTWAREFRGLTIDEAAERLSLPAEDIVALEAGAPMNLTQFRRYANKLRIPLATFLRQTAPETPPVPLDFRTYEGRPATLGFDARLAISYAYTIEQNILELVETDAAPPTPVLPRLRLTEDAAEAGERERRRLNVGHAAQISWDTQSAFRTWRTVIEDAGAYVLQRKFELKDCKGFTIFRNPNAPIIMINKSEEFETAKIFTMAHEYAHLLLRQPGISDLNERNPVEAFCNRFAAGFLMPRALIRELLPYWPDHPIQWAFDDIARWARKLKVSQQALSLRLEQLGVAPVGFFQMLVSQQAHANTRESAGGNAVSTQVSEIGYRFTRAVLNAEDEARISASEASEMLDVAPKHFALIKDRLDQQFFNVNAGLGALPY